MTTSATLIERKSTTRGLTLVAAAGIFLVLAVAATALTYASNNPHVETEIAPGAVKQTS